MHSTTRIEKGDTEKVFPFLYLAIIYFFFTASFLAGQATVSSSTEISFGYPIVQERLPEKYSYNPLFFTARFPIFNNKKRKLFFYAEPQAAVTIPPKEFTTAFEMGINLGLKYVFWESDKIMLAAAIGAGPHYLSLETSLQHKGFLFSDNIELAYYQLLNKDMGMHFKTRFRHLSNANLKKPNLGIDTFFLVVGVFWKITKESKE